MQEHIIKIQYYWKKRMLKKKIMDEILHELYDRQQKNMKVLRLTDTFWDENLDNRVNIYNKISKRLFLPSYESYCIAYDIPLD